MILAIIQCFALIMYGQKAEGLELLRKAERGDIDAITSVVIGYDVGIYGFPQDSLKQGYWTKKGAEAGAANFQVGLYFMYRNGTHGFQKNESIGFEWLLKAANGEDYHACIARYLIANKYRYKDEDKYEEWLKKAAEPGLYHYAMYELGVYYKERKYNNLAIYWLKKSIDTHYDEKGEIDEYSYESLLDLGVKYNPKDKTESSTAVASSESRNNNSNLPKGILYKGVYTVSQQGYCAELGGYTEAFGADYSIDIEIYDDYLWITGTAPSVGRYDYVRTSGNWKIFEGPTSLGTTYYYKVNPDNFNMVHYCTMYNQYTGSTNTWTYSVSKGEVVFNRNSNASIPAGGYGNSGNSVEKSSSGYTRSQKVCGTCDGKGWIPSTRGVASLGQSEKWCPECKKMVPANHYHETCPSCNGKGKW